MNQMQISALQGAITRIKEMIFEDGSQPLRNVKHIVEAVEQMRAADVLEWCGCEGNPPTMETGKCSACGKNARR